MPRGSKQSYTPKQRRQAHQIEDSAKSRGYSSARAKQIGHATVNKQDQGGKQVGGGRARTRSMTSSRKGGRKAGRTSAGRRSRS